VGTSWEIISALGQAADRVEKITFQHCPSHVVYQEECVVHVVPSAESDPALMNNGMPIEVFPALLPKSRRSGRAKARDRVLDSAAGDEIDEDCWDWVAIV